MLDNSYQTIRDYCNTYLYPDGILGCFPESLYLEMLLQPFEEQLDQPSFFIKISNIISSDMLRISTTDTVNEETMMKLISNLRQS
jgi:hypothetical protein